MREHFIRDTSPCVLDKGYTRLFKRITASEFQSKSRDCEVRCPTCNVCHSHVIFIIRDTDFREEVRTRVTPIFLLMLSIYSLYFGWILSCTEFAVPQLKFICNQGLSVTFRMDNVRHSHVIVMIRDTDFREEITSLQLRILPRVPDIHYKAKTGKRQLPRIGF